ncbi:hypothetical protein QYM36_003850 [Artemia franciscana]|uniref:Uncharacterized protein n=1 Tax=Artemia franciscana TaxID=6661 RepID=A0AA88ICH3_ARTSF|nr:hypothetical protein QYM36_003850 [Artemia franciscana]
MRVGFSPGNMVIEVRNRATAEQPSTATRGPVNWRKFFFAPIRFNITICPIITPKFKYHWRGLLILTSVHLATKSIDVSTNI